MSVYPVTTYQPEHLRNYIQYPDISEPSIIKTIQIVVDLTQTEAIRITFGKKGQVPQFYVRPGMHRVLRFLLWDRITWRYPDRYTIPRSCFDIALGRFFETNDLLTDLVSKFRNLLDERLQSSKTLTFILCNVSDHMTLKPSLMVDFGLWDVLLDEVIFPDSHVVSYSDTTVTVSAFPYPHLLSPKG